MPSIPKKYSQLMFMTKSLMPIIVCEQQANDRLCFIPRRHTGPGKRHHDIAIIAWLALSPSSPAPSARRCAASGLDRSVRPSKMAAVPFKPQD